MRYPTDKNDTLYWFPYWKLIISIITQLHLPAILSAENQIGPLK